MQSLTIVCGDEQQVRTFKETAMRFKKLEALITATNCPDGSEPIDVIALPNVSADVLKIALYLVERKVEDSPLELPGCAEPLKHNIPTVLVKDKKMGHEVLGLLRGLQCNGQLAAEISMDAHKFSMFLNDEKPYVPVSEEEIKEL